MRQMCIGNILSSVMLKSRGTKPEAFASGLRQGGSFWLSVCLLVCPLVTSSRSSMWSRAPGPGAPEGAGDTQMTKRITFEVPQGSVVT